jgi:hypothetical protein
MRFWRWFALPALLLACAAVALPLRSARAGVLTSASYTYLLGGRELELPVDMLQVQGGWLVPPELLGALGLTPRSEGDVVLLDRGPVTVTLHLGAEVARIDGQVKLLKAAPLMVAGRLFVPAEVLPDLGAEVTVDGRYVVIHDYLPAAATDPTAQVAPAAGTVGPAEAMQGTIRDGSTLAAIRLVLLTPANVDDPALPLSWGTRLKLKALMEGRTLLLATWQNQSLKATALDPARLMLIDEAGRQYDYLKTEVAVDGQATSVVAPGASKTSVLVYPAVAGPAAQIYYDGAGSPLGRLQLP